MATDAEKDCIAAATSETDSSKSTYADILRAAAVAVAGINTAMAIRMAMLQAEIARDYLEIAKAWRDYYNNVFKPVEDQELGEAQRPYDYVAHHAYTIGQTRNNARVKASHKLSTVIRGTSPYAAGVREVRLKDQLAVEAFALAAMSGLGDRVETAKDDALRDRWWKRREQVINRGRDMIANNVQFSQLAAGIFGDLGKQAAEGAGGAMHYLGYSGERHATNYPSAMSMQSYRTESRALPETATQTEWDDRRIRQRALPETTTATGWSSRSRSPVPDPVYGLPSVEGDFVTARPAPDSVIDWSSR